MEVVERGVANFRDFQKDARDFFADHKRGELERDRRDKFRARWHFWLLGILSGMIIILFGYLLNAVGGHHV